LGILVPPWILIFIYHLGIQELKSWVFVSIDCNLHLRACLYYKLVCSWMASYTLAYYQFIISYKGFTGDGVVDLKTQSCVWHELLHCY
jgi:hypothetical protein